MRKSLAEAFGAVAASAFRAPRKRKRREGSIEESCRVHAQERGWESRKMNGLGFRDWPDRFFISPIRAAHRRSFWVEFKKPGNEPTPSQAIRIADLRLRGEEVLVLDNRADFVKALDARTDRR